MRFSVLASVLLLGALAAGCVDQRTRVYSDPGCDEYGCGPSIDPVVRLPGYGGRPGYGGYPGYRGGGYRGQAYGGPPPQTGYNPAVCSEC